MALTEKLSAIGDAIRAKTGGTELLTLDEMPTEIAAIQTGGSGGGSFSPETHDVVVLSNISRKQIDGVYYAWTDYENYVTDIDDIEFIILYFPGTNSYFYCKGLMTGKDADNCLSCFTGSLGGSGNRVSIYDNGVRMMFNSGLGVQLQKSTGDFYTIPQYVSIYCVIKKGAA